MGAARPPFAAFGGLLRVLQFFARCFGGCASVGRGIGVQSLSLSPSDRFWKSRRARAAERARGGVRKFSKNEVIVLTVVVGDDYVHF